MIEALLALGFGLLIGSFLNVCIHRWPRNRSVIRPRSHCVRCRRIIAWYDNVPVLSYALLGGRCRHCKAHISLRYPLVEALTGVLFFYIVLTLGVTPDSIKTCAFVAMLIALLFSDLEKRILPEQFTMGGLLLGLVLSWFLLVPDTTAQAILWLLGVNASPRWGSFLESATGAFLPSFFLYAGGWVYEKIRHREGLGLGDVWMIAMVGSFLGLRGALFTLIGGSISGSIVGSIYIKMKGEDSATYELPFGTFLAIAAIVVAVFQKQILSLG